jgi:hypothetical protein
MKSSSTTTTAFHLFHANGHTHAVPGHVAAATDQRHNEPSVSADGNFIEVQIPVRPDGASILQYYYYSPCSWTARWIRHNREREEELDRRISNYLNNTEPGTTEVDRNDMRMLSFQAQLALAIMESQRQMMEGGYGNPDGDTNSTPGVSDEARERWDRFQHKEASNAEKAAAKKRGYGSVSDLEQKVAFEEVPHCSICLGEYEEGEELVKLTCNHVYHDECISSWTSNHVKCPLCNFDLDPADTAEEV